MNGFLEFIRIKKENNKQSKDGKKFTNCMPSNLIETLEDKIVNICKKIIKLRIFITRLTFSILSNLKLNKKLTISRLKVITLTGTAYRVVISALKACLLFLSSADSGFGFFNSYIVLSDGDFHLFIKS